MQSDSIVQRRPAIVANTQLTRWNSGTIVVFRSCRYAQYKATHRDVQLFVHPCSVRQQCIFHSKSGLCRCCSTRCSLVNQPCQSPDINSHRWQNIAATGWAGLWHNPEGCITGASNQHLCCCHVESLIAPVPAHWHPRLVVKQSAV